LVYSIDTTCFAYDVIADVAEDTEVPPWVEKYFPAVVRGLDPSLSLRKPQTEWLFEPNSALLEKYGVAAAKARYSTISPNIILQVCNATMDSFRPPRGTVMGTIVEMQDAGCVDIIPDPAAFAAEQGRYSYSVQTSQSKNGWRPCSATAKLP
jgi:hypothetical protein